jgi:PAS domain S-box-containing protein
MQDKYRTKEQLLDELAKLHQQITELEKSEVEHRRTEQALRQSERIYRAIGESIRYGVWVCAPDGRNIYASESFLTMAGLTQEDCSNFGWGKVLHPDDAEKTIAAWQECVRTEGTWNIEHRFRGADGLWHHVLARGIPVRDERGQITCWAGINLDISDLKEAKEALRTAYEELELRVKERTVELQRQAGLLDLVSNAIILCGLGGRIRFWSHGARDIYGFTKDEAEGKLTYNLLKTRFPVPLEEIVDIVQRNGRWEGELTQTRKDGREIIVASKWALEIDEAGRPRAIMEVNLDITDRKRAEEALRTIGSYNRSLIEASPDPLVTIDPEGKISDANTATERVTGYLRKKLIGTDFSDYFTEPEKAKAGYLLVFREGVVRDYELEIRHRDGHVIPVLYNASVYRDKRGRVMGVFAAARDISRRRLMEQALRESEERYRTAIESASDGIALVKDGLHIYVNKRFAEIFGYDDPEEIIGKPLSLTVHPDDFERVGRINIMRLRSYPAPSRYEFKGIKKDGTARSFEVSATRTTYRGEPVALTYLRDITDYKRLEAELRQSHKMEAIGTLAGGIAHDFNNVLSGIIGFTEMVLDDISPDDPAHRRLELVLKGGQRGRDLVRQILAFSRQTEQEVREVPFGRVIEEALQLLRPAIPSTIDIRKTFTSGDDRVLADPVQVQQVLTNLCTNAAYAMRETGGKLEIEVTDADISEKGALSHPDIKPGRYIRLSVSDTGSGISPPDMEKIFDPFFTTKGPGEGTGLGLSVAHGIVKNHGGYIRAYSELNKGTVFHVYLPKVEATTFKETSIPRVIKGGQERILFVDDEEILVEMNCQRFERLGYTVVSSTNGREALDIFKADPRKFDLVITDYTMPQMTGLELARKLVEVRPDIPIILCSGLHEHITTEKATIPGIKAFIPKTSGIQELAELIRKVLAE